MEEIKTMIIQDELEKYKEIVEQNKNNLEYMKEIYDYINNELYNKIIDEEKFIYLHGIIIKDNNLDMIENIKKYKLENYNKVYKYCLIYFLKNKQETNINKKVKILKYIKRYNQINDNILYLKKDIEDINRYLFSFRNKFFKKIGIDGEIEKNNKYEIHVIYQKEEIINRLKILVKKFGIKFMISLKIEIKMLTEIEDYDFDKLLIYYDNVIIKLNIFFEKLMNNLNDYNNISNIYTKIITGQMLINISRYEREFEEKY